ncbi:MAG: hypothetical protein LC623_06135 [Halobacteriales archaeon]|nr:hypothetical protein [Halobacteriales archaeon]
MRRASAILLALPLLTLLAPGAAAHPADLFLFPMAFAGPGVVNCAPGVGVMSPGCYLLPPVTVTWTSLALAGQVIGAGACNVAFEACFAWPSWNPHRAAVPVFWWCQVTSHSPNWAAGGAATIQAHIVYDANADDVLDGAPDLVYSTLAPAGPLPTPAAPRAGQWAGGPLNGAAIPAGAIVHVVATDPMGLLPSLALDTVVTCWVF